VGIIRLFLALAVVYGHVHQYVPGMKFITGDIAVESFFVISGFYMALVLNTKYDAAATLTFYKARLLRLMPTYYLVVIFALLAGLLLQITGHSPLPWGSWADGTALSTSGKALMAFLNTTVLGQELPLFLVGDGSGGLHWSTNFTQSDHLVWRFMLNPPAWSLSLELFFYLLAPFLVRRHLNVLIAIVVASFAIRFGLKYGYSLDHDPWTYRFFPVELGIFLLGSISYKVYQKYVKDKDLEKYKFLILASAYGFWIVAPYIPQFKPIFYPIVTALMIPYVFHISKRNAKDRKIGELSYPVYICHWPIMLVFDSLGYFGAEGPMRQLIMLPTVVAVAYCIYRYFEEPIEKARQNLISKRLSVEA